MSINNQLPSLIERYLGGSNTQHKMVEQIARDNNDNCLLGGVDETMWDKATWCKTATCMLLYAAASDPLILSIQKTVQYEYYFSSLQEIAPRGVQDKKNSYNQSHTSHDILCWSLQMIVELHLTSPWCCSARLKAFFLDTSRTPWERSKSKPLSYHGLVCG